MIGRLFRRKRPVLHEEPAPRRNIPLVILEMSGEVVQDSCSISGDGSDRERLLIDNGSLYALAWYRQNSDRCLSLIAKPTWDDLRQSPEIETAARQQGLLDNPDMLEFPTPYICYGH